MLSYMKNNIYNLFLLPALVFVLFAINSCGDKLDLSQFPITNTGIISAIETTYVQQSPDWTQFNGPEDVCVGSEPLVYIADTKNNRVVQMDIAGNFIGEMQMLNPRKIAQDNHFDLLVIADSIMSIGDTISILYRIKTADAGGIISNAGKINLFPADYPTPTTSRKRKFTGVTAFPDNSLMLTRIGPNNSGLDPDNAIIKLRGRDNITQVAVLDGFQSIGNGIYSVDKTSSICAVQNSLTDFITTRNSSEFGYKVLWFLWDDFNGSYVPKFSPEGGADIVRMLFGTPEDVIQSYGYVFVVDSSRDSLYKFTSNGILRKESFGGKGPGSKQFNTPKGVAFFGNILYIADTGNNRIVRFKLSTEN